MTTKPVISVVMPARNEGERVAQALLSFAAARSELFPLEIVVVDDSSEDGCCDGLGDLLSWERDRAWVRVVRLNRWSGIPYARNCGAAAARGAVLFITDANVEVSRGWDVPIQRDLRPDRALCAAIADRSSCWRGYGCWLDLPSMGTHWLPTPRAYGGYVPVMTEAATILPASLFLRVGGYDTGMPVYGASEPEFSVRLWLHGAEIVQCPDVVLTHRFRPATEQRPFFQRINALLVQNYLRFGLLYLDEAGVARLVRHYMRQSPDCCRRALDTLALSDIWARRRHLKERLTHDFCWYACRFRLPVGEIF